MDKKITFREFNSDVEMLPLELVLMDIPEPDPGKMNFRNKPKNQQFTHFRQPAVVTKIINLLSVKN